MALEMGLLDAIVKRKGQVVDAGTLATEIDREELLIGRRLVFSPSAEDVLTVTSTCYATADSQWLL